MVPRFTIYREKFLIFLKINCLWRSITPNSRGFGINCLISSHFQSVLVVLWRWWVLHTIKPIVRLNLFNYVLVLFRAKFACNSTIRNPVLRWELCKGCVWESVKNWSSVCIKKHSHDWNSRLTREWWLSRIQAYMWNMQKVEGSIQLDHYRTKNIVWPFCYLATGIRNLSQSRVTRQSLLFCRKMTFHIPSHNLL